MDELVREALQEGRLTVAGGGPAALYTPWAVGFEKQYPGITVQVRGAFSNQLVADIDRQLESGAPTVDVAILQTLQDFVRWKAAGALLKTDISAVEQLTTGSARWSSGAASSAACRCTRTASGITSATPGWTAAARKET